MVIDETIGVQLGTNDIAGGNLPPAVLAKFNAIVTAGDNGVDPDGSPLDNNALGFAASAAKTYALVVTNGTDSGVETTGLTAAAGTEIFLYNGTGAESGLILGRVGHENGALADTADAAGKVAFALQIDPVTGQVYEVQYLSLSQDFANNTNNDGVTLATDAVKVQLTITDGDGDQATSAAVSIGNLLQFNDDGPSTPVLTPVQTPMVIDETIGVQLGTNDIAGGNLPPAVLAKFNAIVTAGDNGVDPDGSPLDNNALGFAASTGALVTTSTLAYGVDGAAASGAKTYALVVTNGTDSGVETTGLT